MAAECAALAGVFGSREPPPVTLFHDVLSVRAHTFSCVPKKLKHTVARFPLFGFGRVTLIAVAIAGSPLVH